MTMHALFPTRVYTARLQARGAASLNQRLLRECRQLRVDDAAGRRWSATHYPGGYTSYNSASRMHGVSPTFAKLDEMNFMGKDVPEVLDNLGKFGPLARLFGEATPEQVAKAKQAITEALAPHAKPEGVSLAGACWLVSAAQH